MTAIEKTKNLIRIHDFPLSLMDKNESNPNKMSNRAFDLLVSNMQDTGWTDPALCRPLDYGGVKKMWAQAKRDEAAFTQLCLEHGMRLRIVGGHHRFEGAVYLGFETGPVTIIMDPNFNDEEEAFQVVRMNVIHGKMDPAKFFETYQKMASKYSDEVLQESFGFADEAEFKALVNQMAKTLPDKATADKFKEAAQEVKTIDGLAKLLNHMFTTYGDKVPYGYMIVDYGGSNSMWLRVTEKTMKALNMVGDLCVENRRTMDDLVGGLVREIAAGKHADAVKRLVAETPEVILPAHLQLAPTKDNIEAVKEQAA